MSKAEGEVEVLDAMMQITLDHLREELPDDTGDKSGPWEWYLRVREERPELLFPYLIEPPRGSLSPNYYVLRADPGEEVAVLEQREFVRGRDELRLPFVQSTGSQSGALGPVIKRTYSKDKGPGPSQKINETTKKDFRKIAGAGKPWSGYFEHVSFVISRPKLRFQENLIEGNGDYMGALGLAVREIGERQTCLLSVLDPEGRLPGEVDEYLTYLRHVLAAEKYSTGKLMPIENSRCALSGLRGTVYPNALAGAGLNISNVDRLGVFPGLDDAEAWKKFALSAEVADLLYVYSYHVGDRFLARVAGERALLVPYTDLDSDKRLLFVKRVRDRYVDRVRRGQSVIKEEEKLQDLSQEDAVTSITILWADFGQKLDNVRGMVTDVLPSRLRDISAVIREVKEDKVTPFPELNYGDSLQLDVAFNYLGALLRRPGGKRTEKANKGVRLFELKRDMAAAAYHGRLVPEERLWEEIHDISDAYLLDAMEHGYGLLNEGWNSKKGEAFLTMAGWVRHLCRFLYFLRKLGVYTRMREWRYVPRTERLREVFGEFFEDGDGRTGIDEREKAYAFLLGTLFGKLIQVQGARGVNVGANALPWLKRFTLTGKDLPELYVKIREKLMTYGTESSPAVRDVEEELAHLGVLLGTDIKLNQADTGYFLLLGQSLSRTFMPSGEQHREHIDGEETA